MHKVLNRWRISLFATIPVMPSIATASETPVHEGQLVPSLTSDFLLGFEATLVEDAVVLLVISTALLIGVRQKAVPLAVWLFLPFGIVLGGIVGVLGWVPPMEPAYLATILIGLLAAIAPRFDDRLMWAIMFASAFLMTNAMISGFDWRDIPSLSYVGIAAAIVLAMAMAHMFIELVVKLVPYGWVIIALRATASWTVAIAILMATLLMTPIY